jgi:hypothetical protein
MLTFPNTAEVETLDDRAQEIVFRHLVAQSAGNGIAATHFKNSFQNAWSHCYYHDFQRFSPLFDEKIGVFFKKPLL